MQVIGFVEAPLRLPPWADTLAIVLLIAGLPVAIILAWAQETQVSGGGATTDDAPLPLVTDRPSIAVLPFNNLSGDEEHEYLADGMTEEIITLLAQFSNLFVIARNSTFAYKGTSPDIRDVGRDLGVRYVLEGSIRQVSDRIRITTQLIEAATGAHISAERYDRPLDEIFDVQDELAEAITGALEGQIMSAERRLAAHAPTENLNAWNFYIQSQENRMSAVPTLERLELLQKAVELDPTFAIAWVSIAGLHAFRGWTESIAESTLEADGAAERALGLAPNDPNVMIHAAWVYSFTGRPRESRELALKARDAAPGSASVRGIVANSMSQSGQPEEAIAEAELAFRLSPRDADRAQWFTAISEARIQLEEYEEALHAATEAVRLTPDWARAHLCAANAYGYLDRFEEARASWQRFQGVLAAAGRKPSSVDDLERRTRIQMATDELADLTTAGLRKAGIE